MGEENDKEQEKPEQELPVFADAAEIVLEQDEQRRTRQRPEMPPHPAQNDEDHDLAGCLPGQHGRADETVKVRVKRAGQAGDHAGDDESHETQAIGIDPDGVSRILDLITRLTREHGVTVLLSSHLLHQVQQVCHQIGIIVKGKLIVQGKLDQLGSSILKGRQWNFLLEVDGKKDGVEEELHSLTGVEEIEPRTRGWLLRCTKDVRPELISWVNRKRLNLLQLRSEDPTLEEIYLKYFREA